MKGILYIITCLFQVFSVLCLDLLKANSLSLTVNGGKNIPISGFLLPNQVSGIIKPNLLILEKMKSETNEKLDEITTKLQNVTEVLDRHGQLLSRVGKIVTALKDAQDYLGCYYDDASRHLPYKFLMIDDISLAKCRELCKGYKYLGLQYTIECLCGNVLDKKGYSRVSESECNLPCPGEPTRMCGGYWRNSLYKV